MIEEVDEALFESDCQRCGSEVEGREGSSLEVFQPIQCPKCGWFGHSRFKEEVLEQIKVNFTPKNK